VQSEVTYEPFGTTEISSPSPAYRFTGREHDEPLYLYYHRARYYHPRLQRFISEDPIEFFGGDTNLYAYVKNSPENYTDPTGLRFCLECLPPWHPCRTPLVGRKTFLRGLISDLVCGLCLTPPGGGILAGPRIAPGFIVTPK